jgi:hypothetical protein
MAIGPFREIMADVFNERYNVGGFDIVKAFVYLQTFISRGKI